MKGTAKGGRPPNRYAKGAPVWLPGATRDWFDFPDADLAASRAPAHDSSSGADIRWHATLLLTRLGVPVLRRVIEAMLVFDHGFEPQSVTAALRRLRDGEYQGHRLYQVECTFEDETNHVYCMDRKPTAAELRALARLYQLRSEALNKNALKRAGERYVRAVETARSI